MVTAELNPADPTDILLHGTHIMQKDLISALPSARWSKQIALWHMYCSWSACLALRSTFGDSLTIGPNLEAWAYNELETRIKPCLEMRDQLTSELYPDLYPHQNVDVLFLATAKRAILGNEQGVGKAQPINANVRTPDGWTAIGCLRVGDSIYGKDGTLASVTGIFPQGVRTVYRITCDDGGTTLADEDHLWCISRRSDSYSYFEELWSTKQLRDTLISNPQSRFYLPVAEAEIRPEKDLPLDPYVMGALLGDGSFRGTGVTFGNISPSILERVKESVTLTAKGSRTDVFGVPGINPVVRDLGLWQTTAFTKFIPEIYRTASYEQRLSLLRGLYDTDGTVGSGGTYASLLTCSQNLADNITELGRSLGFKVSQHKRKASNYTYNGNNLTGSKYFTVNLMATSKAPCPFSCDEKTNRWTGRTKRSVTRRISSIELVGQAECVCISVDAKDSLYVTDDHIVTHNTASSIRALLRVNETGVNPFPALVVCPNSMKLSWADEFERWWPGVKTSVIKGTAVQRRKAFEAQSHVKIINWEALRSHSRLVGYGDIALRRCVECGGTEEKITPAKCEVHSRELNQIPWKTVIADEIHRAKDPRSRQSRALKGATGNAEYRWGLTGTVIADSPGDLWSLQNWMEPEAYPSKVKYQERFCQIGYNGYGIEIEGLRPDNKQEFFKAFDPRFRRMTKAVVLPFLPPVVRETRYVEMTPKQSKAYKQMREKMLAQLDSGELLVASNRMTRMGRLLQFASSFGELGEPYNHINKDTGEVTEKQDLLLTDPSSKVATFIDDLDDYGDQSLVVFGVSRQLIYLLSKHLNKLDRAHGLITGAQNEDERELAKNQFQSGHSKLILCTIGAAREGLTLTAASTAVFLQRSWSRIDMEQAMARVHRIGSEIHDSITIVDYVAPDTAELAVIESLGDKGVRFEEVVRDEELLRKVLTSGSFGVAA
jgi:superfamily II DNA or RNA helicase